MDCACNVTWAYVCQSHQLSVLQTKLDLPPQHVSSGVPEWGGTEQRTGLREPLTKQPTLTRASIDACLLFTDTANNHDLRGGLG